MTCWAVQKCQPLKHHFSNMASFFLFSKGPTPRWLNWTLDSEPALLSGFSPPWAHDPFFPLVSGFPPLARGHVMSASRNVLSFLHLSPRSLFPTGQRFSRSNHVTSGSLSPRSFFQLVSGFPVEIMWPPHFRSLPVPVTSLPVMWLPVEPTILMVSGFRY